MPSREPVFAELDALIAAGVARPARPRIALLTKTQAYKWRRRAHPRHYRQHIEKWQDRRAAYLREKGVA